MDNNNHSFTSGILRMDYNFQYCQKIVVLSKDKNKVLLCKRKGEADYDGTFSFIGGILILSVEIL